MNNLKTSFNKAHKMWDTEHQSGSPIYSMRRGLLLKLIKKITKPRARVLDIGCGTGDYLAEFQKLGAEVWGIDVSNYAIDRARTRLGIGADRVKVSTIEEYQNPQQFDIVFMSEVLEHIENDQSALKRINVFLRSGGTLILSVPYDQKLWKYESHEEYEDLRRYSYDELSRIVSRSGINIIKWFCYGFPVLKSYYVLSRTLKPDLSEKSFKVGFLESTILQILKILSQIDKLFLHVKRGVGLIIVGKKND